MIWLRGNKVTVRAHACMCHSIFGQKKMGKVVGTHWKGNESEVGDGLTSNRRWEHRLGGKDKVQ